MYMVYGAELGKRYSQLSIEVSWSLDHKCRLDSPVCASLCVLVRLSDQPPPRSSWQGQVLLFLLQDDLNLTVFNLRVNNSSGGL